MHVISEFLISKFDHYKYGTRDRPDKFIIVRPPKNEVKIIDGENAILE